MTEEERSLTEQAEQPAEPASELRESPQSAPESGEQFAKDAAGEVSEPKTEVSAPAQGQKQKNGFSTAAAFWPKSTTNVSPSAKEISCPG